MNVCMKRLALALLASMVQILPGAEVTYYVNCNATPPGEGSENAPFKTIQAAIEAAKSVDGVVTVNVAAGFYADGTTKCADGGYARVCVTRKSVKIVGAGRDKCFIVGEKGSGTAGLGEGAARCVSIEADDVEISGFTICNGHTTGTDSENANGFGGGVYSHNKANGYVVDCTISNCSAAVGGAIACKNADFANERLAAVRCLITGNRASSKSKTWCDYGASLYWCIVTRHYNDGRSPIESAPKVINCTIDNNYAHHYFHGCKSVCNTFAGRYSYQGGSGSAGWDNFTNVYFTSVKADNAKGGTAEDCTFEGEEKQFVSPLEHDFRPLASAPILTAGKGSLLMMIPEAYRTKDYMGATVDPDSETIAVGAVQKPCESGLSGMVAFPFSELMIKSGDKLVFAGVTNDWYQQEFYCHTTKWPKFLRFEPLLADRSAYGFSASGADAYDRFPLMDGTYLLMPHPSEKLTLDLVVAGKTLYADPDADAAKADGTQGNPFATLQDAVDAIEEGGYAVVYAAEGTYTNGGSNAIGSLKNRVAIKGKHIRLVGKGAEKTFIVGEEDPAAAGGAYGCGDSAMRCICATTSGAVQGFTLTGGRAGAGNEDKDVNKSGTVLASNCGFQVLDCIVSNNISGISAVGFGNNSSHLLFSRCKIMENRTITTKHSGAYALLSDFASCLVAKNRSAGKDYPVFGNNQAELIYDSTVYAEEVDGDYFGWGLGADSTGTHRNSIFAGFGAYRGKDANVKKEVYGIVIDTAIRNVPAKNTYVVHLTGAYKNGAGIAGFANAENGDFRVSSESAACGYASYDAQRDMAAYRLATVSLDGVVPDFDGGFTAGAYRNPAPCIIVKGEGISPLEPVVGPAAGTEVKVSATKASVRPLVGFAVNGVIQEPDGTNYTYVVPAGLAGTVDISAVYGTDWYVDANNGSDDWHGMKKYPFRRICDALKNAISGDTVHVAPGDYNDGKMTHDPAILSGTPTPSRVVVKAGVTLLADGGDASNTFIIGEMDPADETGKGYGDGPDAVRCATVYGGGVLRGFTLTGGRTSFKSGITAAGCGGGVLAQDGNAVVEDCVISNCMALVGGGVEKGTYRRCRIFDCHTPTGNSAAGRYAHFFNCHVDRCRGGRTLGNMYRLKSCTIGPDNTDSDGRPTGTLHEMISGSTLDNCIIIGNIASHAGPVTYSNCLFNTGFTFKDENYVADNCSFVAIEDISLDENGVPRIGSSVAVDTGNGEIYDNSLLGETDCIGNPRFVNGLRLDIGAYEADWKARYSKALGRGVNVLRADASAKEAELGVFLPAGKMELAWPTVENRRYAFYVDVTGTGTLKWHDGEETQTFTAANGKVKIAFSADGTERAYGFEYEPGPDDDGGVVLSDFNWEIGFAISIR